MSKSRSKTNRKKIEEIHVQVGCLLVPDYDDRTGFVSTNLNNQCLMYRGIYQESLRKFFRILMLINTTFI